MPPFKPTKRKELIKALREAGFQGHIPEAGTISWLEGGESGPQYKNLAACHFCIR